MDQDVRGKQAKERADERWKHWTSKAAEKKGEEEQEEEPMETGAAEANHANSTKSAFGHSGAREGSEDAEDAMQQDPVEPAASSWEVPLPASKAKAEVDVSRHQLGKRSRPQEESRSCKRKPAEAPKKAEPRAAEAKR